MLKPENNHRYFTTEIINSAADFSALAINFSALSDTSITLLGQSCDAVYTPNGFIVLPRKSALSAIFIKSSHWMSNGNMASIYLFLEITWKDAVPIIAEVSTANLREKQILMNRNDLSVITDNMVITTGDKTSQGEHYSASHSDFCRYYAETIGLDDFLQIREEVQNIAIKEKAVTIETLQQNIASLKNELTEVRDLLEQSRGSILEKETRIEMLQLAFGAALFNMSHFQEMLVEHAKPRWGKTHVREFNHSTLFLPKFLQRFNPQDLTMMLKGFKEIGYPDLGFNVKDLT